MKKSDAVRNLETFLFWNRGLADRDLSIAIINYITGNFGMKPPCCTDFGGHGVLDKENACKDYVESCDFWWETEDDKK